MIRTTEEMILSPSKSCLLATWKTLRNSEFQKVPCSVFVTSLCSSLQASLSAASPTGIIPAIVRNSKILQTLPFPWLNACPWCISNFCSHIHIYTIHKAYKHRLCSGSLLLSISNSWQHFREFGPARVFFSSFKTDNRTWSTCVIL